MPANKLFLPMLVDSTASMAAGPFYYIQPFNWFADISQMKSPPALDVAVALVLGDSLQCVSALENSFC